MLVIPQIILRRTDRYLGERWTIVFCPVFFNSNKLRYLQERTEGKRDSETSVALQMTYEHIIVHEFMHVGMFGYKYKSKSDVSSSTTCPKTVSLGYHGAVARPGSRGASLR
jgi:hypothetical protein